MGGKGGEGLCEHGIKTEEKGEGRVLTGTNNRSTLYSMKSS
jgi:hypothetical protein